MVKKSLLISLVLFNAAQAKYALLDIVASTCQAYNLPLLPSKDEARFSLSESFVRHIAAISKYYDIHTFIETGTYLGDTTQRVAQHFDKVLSVELGYELFARATVRFMHNQSIELLLGDSGQVLPKLLPTLQAPYTIFLDGHYSAGITAKGERMTPIMQELRAIKESGAHNIIVLVDDIRMFYTPQINVDGTPLEGYPTLGEIVRCLLDINKNFKFAVISDVLCAFPENVSVGVSPLIRACTISRLSEDFEIDDQTLLQEEYVITQAWPQEVRAIRNLVENFTESWTRDVGIARHHPLWYGLILKQQGNFIEAVQQFKEAQARGITHWRVAQYIEQCSQ